MFTQSWLKNYATEYYKLDQLALFARRSLVYFCQNEEKGHHIKTE